jgi:hypothetical protein
MKNQRADLTPVPPELRRVVHDELGPDEQLRWVGQPDAGTHAMRSIPVMLIGIVFAGMSLFIMSQASAMGTGGPSLFPLFGCVFVLIGLGVATAPFWMAWTAGRTVYMVTSRRAVIFQQRMGLHVKSYDADDFTDYERIERGDGRGDIIFRHHIWHDNKGQRQSNQEGFIGIENVRHVDDLLQDLMARGDRDRPD